MALAICLAIGVVGTPAYSQISVGIGLPRVQIGFNVPADPQLVVAPGYPVYYAPSVDPNLFFYDGLYWCPNDDTWYSNSWYTRTVERGGNRSGTPVLVACPGALPA